jgi:hypothetical protein
VKISAVEEVTSSVRWGLNCDVFPTLKKASAVLDKANNIDNLNVFGEFVASELRGLRNDSARKINIQCILLNAGIEGGNVSTDLNSQSSSRTSTPLSVSSSRDLLFSCIY